jgi:hypothetical protein
VAFRQASPPRPPPAVCLHVLLVRNAADNGRAAHQKDMKAKSHAGEPQSPEGA